MNLSLARQHYSMTKESKIESSSQNAFAIKLAMEQLINSLNILLKDELVEKREEAFEVALTLMRGFGGIARVGDGDGRRQNNAIIGLAFHRSPPSQGITFCTRPSALWAEGSNICTIGHNPPFFSWRRA